MRSNLSVWGYYKKGFVDPLYAPYQRTCVEGEMINTWKVQGPPSTVEPRVTRRGLGAMYQRKNSVDACPHGWKPAGNSYCVEDEPESRGTLYTADAHVPKYQYHSGYTVKQGRPSLNEFDAKSVNPFTGEYESSHRSKPAASRVKYGGLPSRDSLLS